jgi:glycerol-3-phosphate dehydrogenase
MLYGTPDRETAWSHLSDRRDLIVVGGGITGAGILREAVRVGLNVLLLEQNDFASGTSSRSSKLVHGGLRYLRNCQFRLTWQAVHERETLLEEGIGLIEPLPFLFPTYDTDRLSGRMVEAGLYMSAWMSGRWRAHQTYDRHEVRMMSPGLADDHLTGGLRFYDAQTDDARLVLRVIREGVKTGHAVAINHACVEGLLRDRIGRVKGVVVRDRSTDRVYEARAAAVVNATGAWADRLRGKVGAARRIRPLRGSHLLFRQDRFPVYQAISFPHPDDGRPVYAFPWEGVTLLGTTDLDHPHGLDREPAITPEEVAYLLHAAQDHFPRLALTADDVLSTFSGVRAVIGSGQGVAPSKESREHAIWNENGLLTVTGGKLTTFRCMALDALRALRRQLPCMAPVDDHLNALDPTPPVVDPPPGLARDEALRLAARYGAGILDFAAQVPEDERERVDGLPVHWFEFRWAARHEAIIHLDDLLLRRVRIGLLAPNGGEKHLPRIRHLVQAELDWDDTRWEQEVVNYLTRWRMHYSTPVDVSPPRVAAIA